MLRWRRAGPLLTSPAARTDRVRRAGRARGVPRLFIRSARRARTSGAARRAGSSWTNLPVRPGRGTGRTLLGLVDHPVGACRWSGGGAGTTGCRRGDDVAVRPRGVAPRRSRPAPVTTCRTPTGPPLRTPSALESSGRVCRRRGRRTPRSRRRRTESGPDRGRPRRTYRASTVSRSASWRRMACSSSPSPGPRSMPSSSSGI